MPITEFRAAIKQIATERGITEESVLDSVRSALASAYKKDRKEHGEVVDLEEITVKLDPDTGEARILKKGKDVTPSGFGRIAAQTAKQVILQKIRESEKEVAFNEFKDKVGQIVTGQIFRIEGGVITLDLGKSYANGILPYSEQVPSETYRINQRLKVLVKEVKESPKGTEIIVSRADPQFVVKLFEQEVPEVANGTVVIEAIAREAGSRTKMAVSSKDDRIDPVGSCVGQKGIRVQAIISELFGEKIDIVPYSPVTEKFIAASLAPARVTEVVLDKDEHRAVVSVPEDQQSLAIGKEGQNARLANKLTTWRIDIKGAAGLFSTDTGVVNTPKEEKVVGVWDEAIKKVDTDTNTVEDSTENSSETEEPVQDTSELEEAKETTN